MGNNHNNNNTTTEEREAATTTTTTMKGGRIVKTKLLISMRARKRERVRERPHGSASVRACVRA